jgi:peroxiredoxin
MLFSFPRLKCALISRFPFTTLKTEPSEALMRILYTLIIGLILFGAASGQEYRMIGKLPAPAMLLTDIGGRKLDTRELAGKTVVYNLWFVGCPPCMAEIPKLNAIVDQFPDVVFIGLSSSSAADINKFIAKQPFAYQLIPNAAKEMLTNFGNADARGALNVGFPTHVVVNPNGYIEYRESGAKGVDGVRKALEHLALAK